MPRIPSRCYTERPPRHLGRVLKAVLTASLLALNAIALAAPSGEARLKDYLKGLNTLASEFRQYTL
ncbi:MAG: hypothetical protein KAX51_12540, partial [Chromatiaceae bacterium]|nr:hypothetical protein [Chromatiaceae bacterium]